MGPQSLTDDTKRPSPEALLEKAEQEMRGRLKIFLGAAPGVGKTYEMLMSGRARKADGDDVVIGMVETHGREETEALVEGLEVIPRTKVAYKGQHLEEMDLDAVLERHPQLVLVDELAHSNAPGSRHPKRYLDVLEILDRGIDVYTTLNIQHIESLNDVVAQITRIRVRETVPDTIIDRADDVEIIDLTPDDLIRRLHEGKVYLPKIARRAIENYFSPGNLTALRELALRRTAQRVDQQLLSQMRAQAIEGPWPAGERVLVCISEDSRSAGLIRYAKRLADRLYARWTALYVEGRRNLQLSEDERDRVAEALRLAQNLEGDAVTIPGGDGRVADDVIAYAHANNITHIVIGKSSRSRWFEILHGSVVHELVRRAGNISVHVVAGDKETEVRASRRPVETASLRRRPDWMAYGKSTLVVAAAIGVGLLLWPWIGVEHIGLIFLTAVVTVAVWSGLLPSLYTSVISAASYNFFFTDPYHTFLISRPREIVSVVFFTIVAIIVSNVAAQARAQTVAARARARTTESLYSFSRKLAGAGVLEDVLWATAYQMASMLNVRVVILLPDNGAVAVRAGYPPDDTLVDADIAAARWAWEHNRPAGRGADTLPGAKRLYLPLITGSTPVGVVGLDNDRKGPLLTPEQQRLFDALADQAAVAIERIQLVAELDRARLAAEADKLRSALLTSISHDLKTPLASILGAAGTLRDYANAMSEADRADLLATVIDESERLNRFIANLLDMTRIETGAMEPNASLQYLDDIVGSALRRASKITSRHRTVTEISPNLPMLKLDPVLFEQVLFNLFDNAAKYAPPSTTIRIRAWDDGRWATIQIIDEGPGIPPADLERVFDSFHRVRKGDHVLAGTGLGLSICKGFIEAMGGTITASNRTDRSGAIFTIRMPVPTDRPKLEEL
ncbi:sensor histidine kinase [Candidatus Macondimonas diazotrophica]|jgi:two-component system sensor histidine kinase KdpD|uniref:histidine kinase n=1 Tax=Candidatus Macondimonas diazotrophica TaxID=2305248 RepID=A0A4Z0FCJ3_9GAMM|nr:sensor histidine kinase KdpD [Candidatus Macondimonas diazotrophica]NCU02088.1 sensor histidine kinase KdpD [Candidatus Macondimonas diazotrophica]TFZ84004.1 sensor histidine kinase KdpD [Candidatus Macondimonas diazotrophica]